MANSSEQQQRNAERIMNSEEYMIFVLSLMEETLVEWPEYEEEEKEEERPPISSSKRCFKEGDHQDTCTICLEKFECRERLRVLLPCEHAFHPKCIKPWLRENESCPLCKRPVVYPPPPPNTTFEQDIREHDDVFSSYIQFLLESAAGMV